MKRVIEYLLVVLIALIVVAAGIWFYWKYVTPGGCTNCVAQSRPKLRAECDKQFYSTNGPEELNAEWQREELIAFVQPASYQSSTSSDGYSSATGSTTAPPSYDIEPGYIMLRIQPSDSQSSGGGWYRDPSSWAPGTNWNEVTVLVARYVNELRSDRVCEGPVTMLEGKFEYYCDLDTRLGTDNYGQVSFRVFIKNASSIPVDYCVVSNCSASAPWGAGKLCNAEREGAGS